jgi:transglutaminase-like putative cysteine protease
VRNSENIQIVPYNNSSTRAGWDDAHNHPRIITIASTIIGNTGNSDEAKIRGIWNWMHGSDRHMIYHAHEGTKDSLDQGLDSGKGNCCEQARILVGLARAAGMKAEFVKVPGHVFSRIFVNGAWMAVDTCYEWGYNRKIPYGATLCDVLNW